MTPPAVSERELVIVVPPMPIAADVVCHSEPIAVAPFPRPVAMIASVAVFSLPYITPLVELGLVGFVAAVFAPAAIVIEANGIVHIVIAKTFTIETIVLLSVEVLMVATFPSELRTILAGSVLTVIGTVETIPKVGRLVVAISVEIAAASIITIPERVLAAIAIGTVAGRFMVVVFSEARVLIAAQLQKVVDLLIRRAKRTEIACALNTIRLQFLSVDRRPSVGLNAARPRRAIVISTTEECVQLRGVDI